MEHGFRRILRNGGITYRTSGSRKGLKIQRVTLLTLRAIGRCLVNELKASVNKKYEMIVELKTSFNASVNELKNSMNASVNELKTSLMSQ